VLAGARSHCTLESFSGLSAPRFFSGAAAESPHDRFVLIVISVVRRRSAVAACEDADLEGISPAGTGGGAGRESIARNTAPMMSCTRLLREKAMDRDSGGSGRFMCADHADQESILGLKIKGSPQERFCVRRCAERGLGAPFGIDEADGGLHRPSLSATQFCARPSFKGPAACSFAQERHFIIRPGPATQPLGFEVGGQSHGRARGQATKAALPRRRLRLVEVLADLAILRRQLAHAAEFRLRSQAPVRKRLSRKRAAFYPKNGSLSEPSSGCRQTPICFTDCKI